MSSFHAFSVNPNLPVLCKPNVLLVPTAKPLSSFQFHCKSLVCRSSDDDERSLWLREEQRWLREERRWLREEKRWEREREYLLREIDELKLQIQGLERRISSQMTSTAASFLSTDAIANVSAMLQILKEKSNLIPESGSSTKPMERVIGVERKEEERGEKGAVTEEKKKVVAVSESDAVKKRSALRIGSEGDDVRAMQVFSNPCL